MSGLRLLHTADWQMGMRAAHVGSAGARVRQARLEAARRLVRAAGEAAAHLMVVAGDTFESNGVDRLLVQQVADILASAQIPVFVIPGNHDPLVPGSVWEHPAWQRHPSIRILREAVPVDLSEVVSGDGVPRATLFPCPLFAKYSTEDPTLWIDPERRPGDGIRIGLGHGTVQGAPIESEPDYPIPRDAATRRGLDYLALGHWHSYASYPDPAGCVRMAYSGTHETTKFGERDSGNALLVEISAPGAAPVFTPIRTGGLTWKVLEPELRTSADLERLCEHLENEASPEATLIDLRPSGLMDPSDSALVDRIRTLLDARFLYGRLELSRLYCASPEGDVAWIEALPPGVARGVALRLAAWASSGSAPVGVSQEEGPDPAVAARALRELYVLAREGSAS